jgi:hypothetical protein
MFRLIICAGLFVGLAGCSPNMAVKPVQFGETKGVVSGANLRLVTERRRSAYPSVVCSEPSPDYAVAFGSNRTLKITPPVGSSHSPVEVGSVTSEFVLEGEGRAEAVLALRDGLYTACQSYANGIIGKDAYAIILSQHGNLLLGLVGKAGAGAVPASGPNAAMSAMTVACISGHDGSRPGSTSNSLLTHQFCSKVLRAALARSGPSVGVTVNPTKKDDPVKAKPGGKSPDKGADGEKKGEAAR